MNPFEFVLIIIGMSFVMAIVIKKMELSSGGGGKLGFSRRELSEDPQATQENERLRKEVSELKERIHVLERIATDKENSLAREIDSLRDR